MVWLRPEMGGNDSPEVDCDMPDANNDPPAAQNQPIGTSNAMPPPSAPKNHRPNKPFAYQAHNQGKNQKPHNRDAQRRHHQNQGPAHRIAKKQKRRPPHGAPRGPRADLWPHQGPDLYRPSYGEPRYPSSEFQIPPHNGSPLTGVNLIPLGSLAYRTRITVRDQSVEVPQKPDHPRAAGHEEERRQ